MQEPIKSAETVARIPNGATLMIGGFMGVGTPDQLVQGLVEAGRKNLTAIGNDTARPSISIARLIDAGAVSRVITSHIGTNPETLRQMIEGLLEVELVPQVYNALRLAQDMYAYPKIQQSYHACNELAELKSAAPEAQPDAP